MNALTMRRDVHTASECRHSRWSSPTTRSGLSLKIPSASVHLASLSDQAAYGAPARRRGRVEVAAPSLVNEMPHEGSAVLSGDIPNDRRSRGSARSVAGSGTLSGASQPYRATRANACNAPYEGQHHAGASCAPPTRLLVFAVASCVECLQGVEHGPAASRERQDYSGCDGSVAAPSETVQAVIVDLRDPSEVESNSARTSCERRVEAALQVIGGNGVEAAVNLDRRRSRPCEGGDVTHFCSGMSDWEWSACHLESRQAEAGMPADHHLFMRTTRQPSWRHGTSGAEESARLCLIAEGAPVVHLVAPQSARANARLA